MTLTAFNGPDPIRVGYKVGEDLSAGLYKFGVVGSTGTLTVNATAGAACDGIIASQSTSGNVDLVHSPAIYKVIASAAITALDDISSTSEGLARTAVAGDVVLGKALHAVTASGDTVTVELRRGASTSVLGALPTAMTLVNSFATADPSAIKTYAKYTREGNRIHCGITLASSDGAGATGLTITIPVTPTQIASLSPHALVTPVKALLTIDGAYTEASSIQAILTHSTRLISFPNGLPTLTDNKEFVLSLDFTFEGV